MQKRQTFKDTIKKKYCLWSLKVLWSWKPKKNEEIRNYSRLEETKSHNY